MEIKQGQNVPGEVVVLHKIQQGLRLSEAVCPGSERAPAKVIEQTATQARVGTAAVIGTLLVVGLLAVGLLVLAGMWLLGGDSDDGGGDGPTGRYTETECVILRAEALRDDNPRRLDDLAQYSVHCE